MVVGHFATAVAARKVAPAAPIAFYLVVSQFPDFLWHLFHYLGIEVTTPENPMMASLSNMHVEMTYSHDLLPTLGWIVLVTVVGRVLFGNWKTGVTGGTLILVHGICDAVSGHTHYVYGPDSVPIGLGLYATSPFIALAIEGVFTLGVMGWVIRKDAIAGLRRSRVTKVVWSVVFIGGLFAMFPTANLSIVERFGLEPISTFSGTLIPGLVVMYLSMFVALVWVDRRNTVSVD